MCPVGWRVPTDADWINLEIFLGMTQQVAEQMYWRGSNEGSKLKSSSGWDENGNGTNASGFTALPGGYRDYDGTFFLKEIGQIFGLHRD